jgi:ABC-type branched-subunit amino acid transport system substrate-binding protein
MREGQVFGEPDDGLGGISRRQMLGGMLGGGALLALAACSSSGGTGGGSNPSGSTGGGKISLLDNDEIATLKSMLGPIDPKYSAKGQTWKLGGAFPLTGPLTFYNVIQGDGLKLAAAHIPQLGGPKIDLSVQNVGGPQGIDPQKAVDVVLNLHGQHVGAVASMDYNAVGTLNPWVEKYKILSIDPGAGVGAFPNKPYFWGMRCHYPYSVFIVGLEYFKQKLPGMKKGSLVYYTGASNAGQVKSLNDAITTSGYQLAGNALSDQGVTDFSAAIAQLRSQQPDFIALGSSGNDAAYFMKQYVTSGINKPVLGCSFSGPQAKIAGDSFNDMYVCQEDFLPDSPSNDWAGMFAKHYRTSFGDQGSARSNSPLNNSAAYYAVGFLLWELARDVLAKGGDINDGSALQSALEAKLKFPSIYGGSGSTPGTIEFDPTTHGLKHEPLGVFQVKSGVLTRVASGDSAGGNLQLSS